MNLRLRNLLGAAPLAFGLTLLLPGAASALPGGATPTVISINRDLTNLGPTAYDVAIVLKGNSFWYQPISATALGTFHTFTTRTNSSGDTVFHWENFDRANDGLAGGKGEPIVNGQRVHVGIDTRVAQDVVTMYWTDEKGRPIFRSAIYDAESNVTYRHPDPGAVLELQNHNDTEVRIGRPRFTIVGAPYELAALGQDNQELMEALKPLGDDIVLAPGETVEIEIPAEVPAGSSVVTVYEVTSPGSSAVLVNYMQAAAPQSEDGK